MKKIFFIFAICGLIFTSCTNKTNENHPEGTHTHADGTVHEGTEHQHGKDCDHDHDTADHKHDADCDHDHDKPAQETFVVETDSVN